MRFCPEHADPDELIDHQRAWYHLIWSSDLSLYALDSSWRGRRWPGDVHQLEDGSSAVGLAHGDPFEPDEAAVQVVTVRPPSAAVERLVLAHANVTDGQVEVSTFRPLQHGLRVGGSVVDGEVVVRGQHWLCRLSPDPETTVYIEGVGGDPAHRLREVSLEVADDLYPYVDGHLAIVRHLARKVQRSHVG